MGSELVPSCLEGAVFPELPGAAGVIAIANYRGRGKIDRKIIGNLTLSRAMAERIGLNLHRCRM
jgi:hypothetical protein